MQSTFEVNYKELPTSARAGAANTGKRHEKGGCIAPRDMAAAAVAAVAGGPGCEGKCRARQPGSTGAAAGRYILLISEETLAYQSCQVGGQ